MARQRPLLTFFLLAYAWAWLVYIPMVIFRLPLWWTAVATVGPTFAALLTHRLSTGSYSAFRVYTHWAPMIIASAAGAALIALGYVVLPALVTADPTKLQWNIFLSTSVYNYLQKGSSLWYWRQVLKAIPISVLKELRAHRWIAARAVLTGWTIWTLFIVLIYPLFTPAFFGGNAVGVEIQPLHPVGSAWSVLWAPVLFPVGFSPSSPLAFLLLIQIALPLVVWAMVGWIVARVDIGIDPEESSGPRLVVRFHRDLVFLFAGSILLLNILLVGPFLSFVGAPGNRFVAPLAAHAVASALAILLGGSLGGSKKANLG